MMAYIALVILGAPIAWGAGRLIEVFYPQNVALSTFVFMGVLTLVLLLGEVDASPESMRRLVKRIAAKHGQSHFCYEAGPTGYGLHRLITCMGHPCTVVAPSLIPRKAGDR